MRIRSLAAIGAATLLVSSLGAAPANAAAQGCGKGYHSVKRWKANGGTAGGTWLRQKGNTYCLVVYRNGVWKNQPPWFMVAEMSRVGKGTKTSSGHFKSHTKPIKMSSKGDSGCVHVFGWIDTQNSGFGSFSIDTWYCRKK